MWCDQADGDGTRRGWYWSTEHERLDVYHLALDFLVFANEIIEALSRGHSHLAD
jgi:hypothetical protein